MRIFSFGFSMSGQKDYRSNKESSRPFAQLFNADAGISRQMKTLALATFSGAMLCVGCTKMNAQAVAPQVSAAALATQSTKAILINNGALGDTNIKYFGRWDFSSSTQYVSYWGGAYIKVNFTGTTAKIKLGNTSNFYYKIDNGSWTTLTGVTGTVNLTPTALTSGTHTLSVAQGKDYDYIFNFQGFVFDAGATTSAPSVGTDLVEYIGDSITAGYTDPQAEVSDYAWVCAEHMGAEHTQIAYPGITLVNGFGINATKIGMDVQYFKQQSLAFPSSPDWNFATYTPKIVVINLGQNDQSTGVTDANFQTDMVTFLGNIRAKFASAQIFVMAPFMQIKVAPAQAAVGARIAAGDNNVHFVATSGWLVPNSADYTGNSGVHPSVAGHNKVANFLQPYLAPYLSSGSAIYLDHCDATTGWVSGNPLTADTGDKKEGTASLQSNGSGTLDFQKQFATPINSGTTLANGSIDFWYYVSDVTKLGTNNQIEVGSGGTNDVNELDWDMGPLVNGWNHITKTFATANTAGGAINLSAINWFRIYHAKTGSVITKVDAVRILH